MKASRSSRELALPRLGWAAVLTVANVGVYFFALPHWKGVNSSLTSTLALATFAIAIQLHPVSTQFGRLAWHFTPNELPLLVLMAALGPHSALLVWTMATTACFAKLNWPNFAKLVFNAASTSLGASIVFAFVRQPLGKALTLQELGVLLVGLMVREFISAATLRDVFRRIGTQDGRFFDIRTVLTMGASGLMTGCLGIVGLGLYLENPILLLPTVVLAGTFVYGNRVYLKMRERMLKVERLYEFAEVFSRDNESRAEPEAVVERARRVLSAGHTEVAMVTTDENNRPVAIRLVSDAITGFTQSIVPIETLPAPFRQILLDGESVRFGTDADPIDGLIDTLITAIRFDTGIAGAFTASDRLGDQTAFTDDDLKLFETMVSHASAWFENGSLVDRLRLEITQREHEALHDALTDLPNRRMFQARAELAIGQSAVTHSPGAVLLLDLDSFKEINDALGHETGDRVLQIVGERLQQMLPQGAMVARLGGDEFAILLPSIANGDEAGAVADRIAAELNHPIEVDSLSLRVEASVGIALFPSDGTDAALILQRADVAMYTAKTAKLGSQFYSPERDFSSARRLSLLSDLRYALDRDELVLWHQPKVLLATGEVIGVECLVRWRHPVLGLVFPDDFIPLAEQSGLIGELGMTVMTKALAQQQIWRKAGHRFSVAVNLSVRNLLNMDLAADIGALLCRFGADPGTLTIEITESAIMSDPVRARTVLQMVRSLGVRISVDDFGVGQSSLAYLRDLPVSEVKIDKCFVRTMGLADGKADDKIARSIIDLGRNLELDVVAEGVEDELAFLQLRDLGCGIAQGYFIARPLPAADFDAWYRNGRGHVPTRPALVPNAAAR